MERLDLALTNLGIGHPCYTAKQDSVADQEEDSNSQEPPSPSGSDFRNPIQQESEYDHQLLVTGVQTCALPILV